MKKRPLLRSSSLIICCLILLSQCLTGQTIEKWYVNMPDILNPTMTKQNRMELLEYHKAGQGDSIANRFGHPAFLVKLDTAQQHIVVKNTPTSTFEMKVFKQDSTSIVGIIRTVCAPVCISTVEFYDTAWHSVPLVFTMPKAIEWLDLKSVPAAKLDTVWVKHLLEMSFITLTYSDKDQVIVAKSNTLDFLSEEDRKVIAPYMSDKAILFELKGQTWQRKL